MIVSNLVTGFVNFLTFLSLTVTTSSANSFLGATFILGASIFLEALSLQNESKQIKSLVVFGGALFLYLIGIAGCLFSIVGLAKFINVYFDLSNYRHVTIASTSRSIYSLAPTDVNRWFIYSGVMITLVPLWLASREILIGLFRKSHYNLDHGLWGK